MANIGMGVVADTITEDFAMAAKLAAQWGLSNIELYRLWHKNIVDLSDAEVQQAAQIAKDHGLTITNIASLIMRCPPTDGAEQENLRFFERAVEIGQQLGTNRVRCYAFLKQPSLEEVWPRIMSAYEELLKRAENLDVTLLFENSSYANIQTASELHRFLDAIDHPRLRLLWDPGNSFALGDPVLPTDAWHLLKDRVAHLHIKDSERHGSNRWTSVGSGALDLNGLIGALIRDGYDGIASLEAYFPDDTQEVRESKIELSVRQLRRVLDRHARS